MSTTTMAAPPNGNAALTKLQDWPYRFEVVRLDEMYVDRYQRPLSSFLKTILRDYNPALLGTLTLSERPKRNKRYAIVDGQTRAEAMREKGLEQAPCVVFYELTLEAEAELFSLFQRMRKSITPMQRFKADIIARNPDALALNRIIEAEGFKMTEEAHPYPIKAVRAVEAIYADDPERLRTTLRLIRETWKTMPYATNEHMIKGVAGFLADMEQAATPVDEQRFVDRLGALTPSEIDKRARMLRDARGVSTGIGVKFTVEVIQQGYRTKRRASR